MANSIGWGLGASNNEIGWGQGPTNNNIGWGYAHQLAYAGQTDIIGGLLYIKTFVDSFQSRVTIDSGTFESYACVYNFINGELSNGAALNIVFKGLVGLDSGQYEAGDCLINFCNNLT
jgi:hypothetical protein